jgi:hypothetical protein
MLDIALVASQAILFCSLGLWIYWIARLELLLGGSADTIGEALDRDVACYRKLWLNLRMALSRSSDLLTI